MNNSNIMLVPNFSEATSVVELHESKRAKINAPKKSKLELTYNAFLENMVPTQNEVSGNVSTDDKPLTKYDAFATTHNIEVIIGDYKEASNTGARKLRVAGVLPPIIADFAKEKAPVVEEKKEEPEVPKSEPVETKVKQEEETKEDIKITPVESPAKDEPLSRVKVHEDTYDISDDKGESAVAYSKQINLNNSNIDAYLKNAAMPNLDDPLYQKYGQELDSIMKQKQEYREKIAYLEEVKRNYDDEIAKAKKQKEIIEAEKAKEYEAKILQETQSLDGIVAQYQELKAAIEAQKVELATYKDE